VSIHLQEFPHRIFLFHYRLLTSGANLRVASTSVPWQPCFNVIVWIPHLQLTLLVQKGVGTRSHTKKNVWERRSHALPPHYTPAYNAKYFQTLPREKWRYFANSLRSMLKLRSTLHEVAWHFNNLAYSSGLMFVLPGHFYNCL